MAVTYKVLTPLMHDQTTYGVGELVDHAALGDDTATHLARNKVIELLPQSADGATPDVNVYPPPLAPESPIPSQEGDQQSTKKGEASQDAAPSPLNLNQAEEAALEALPYIGPKTAERLIDNRPYETLDQAREASGLSAAKWDELLPQLSI
ncbi:MAG: ComEA family DNA-binding protein [Leptolyngbyaceae cyanobacterium]